MPPRRTQEEQIVPQTAAVNGSGGVKTAVSEKTAATPVTLRSLLTLEMIIYAVCHVFCFGMAMFAPGNVPILSPRGGLLRQHHVPVSRSREKNAFDVFRKAEEAANRVLPVPYQLSSDLVLTVLIVFTANAVCLTLLRSALKYLQDNAVATETTKEALARRSVCHDVVKDFLMNISALVCIISAVGILMQKGNQVRGVGPCIVLLSAVVEVCILQTHGGMESLVRFLGGYQTLLIIALICLVADANVFSDGLV